MRVPWVLLATLLAGCSTLAPPPAPASPVPEEVPAPAPVPSARAECVGLSVQPAWDDLQVAAGHSVALTVRIEVTCGGGAELLPVGDCPSEFLRVEIIPGLAHRPRGVLREEGAAFTGAAPCPDRVPATPARIPEGFALTRTVVWNGTFATPCALSAGLGCFDHRRADAVPHEVVAWVALPHPEIPRWLVVAQTPLLVRERCVHLWVEAPERLPARVVVEVDNATQLNAHFDPDGMSWGDASARWCGEGGQQWVRYQDSAAGIDEAATLDLRGETLVVRPSPLRVAEEPRFRWS